MKKSNRRQYRSVAFDQVDFERIGEAVRGEDVVFGVDAAKRDFAGSIAVGEDVKSRIRWEHPRETAALAARIAELPAASITMVMEPSGTYGDPLRHLLACRGIQTFRVSPKRSHDAAEVFDGVPSWHDVKSSEVLVRLHAAGASEPWREPTDEERDLAAAIKIMHMYDGQEAANASRLESMLARHWPEVLEILRLTSATLPRLIDVFGGPAQVKARGQEARQLMRRIGGHLLDVDKIGQVILSAGATVGVPMTVGEVEAVREIAAEILRCREAARRARKKVEELSRSNAAVNNMASLVGRVTAAVVVSGLGDPRAYTSAKGLVKSAGANLREKSSGRHKGQLKITKRGPSEVRYYLYLAALRLISKDRVVDAWYQRKVARDGGRYKNRAVIAVMRKLLKALWHVARGKQFDSTLLFDTTRLALSQ